MEQDSNLDISRDLHNKAHLMVSPNNFPMDNPGDINKAMDSHNNKEVQGGVNNLNRDINIPTNSQVINSHNKEVIHMDHGLPLLLQEDLHKDNPLMEVQDNHSLDSHHMEEDMDNLQQVPLSPRVTLAQEDKLHTQLLHSQEHHLDIMVLHSQANQLVFQAVQVMVAMEMEEIMEDPVNQPQAMPHKVITHMEATEDPQGVDIRDQDPHHQAHHIIPTDGESITNYHYHY